MVPLGPGGELDVEDGSGGGSSLLSQSPPGSRPEPQQPAPSPAVLGGSPSSSDVRPDSRPTPSAHGVDPKEPSRSVPSGAPTFSLALASREIILDPYLTPAGVLTAKGRKLLAKRKFQPEERDLKDDILLCLYEVHRGAKFFWAAMSKATGMSKKRLQRAMDDIQERMQAMGLLEERVEHERALMRIRFENQSELLNEYRDLEVRAMRLLGAQLHRATPTNLVQIAKLASSRAAKIAEDPDAKGRGAEAASSDEQLQSQTSGEAEIAEMERQMRLVERGEG